METTNITQINNYFLAETMLDKRTIQIPVFLFFTCPPNNRSDCGKQFIPKHDSNKHSSLPWCEMWYTCTCTSYQWLRPMLAWCHCGCESNQGCTSHTRISQSNLFSSFLLCASFTHPCTLTASMHVHTLASWEYACTRHMCPVQVILILRSWLLRDSYSIHVSELFFDLMWLVHFGNVVYVPLWL